MFYPLLLVINNNTVQINLYIFVEFLKEASFCNIKIVKQLSQFLMPRLIFFFKICTYFCYLIKWVKHTFHLFSSIIIYDFIVTLLWKCIIQLWIGDIFLSLLVSNLCLRSILFKLSLDTSIFWCFIYKYDHQFGLVCIAF